MHNRADKLYFLRHALAEIFDFFVPPVGDLEFPHPRLTFFCCGFVRQALQAGEVDQLLTYFKLLVQTALLRQIANGTNVLLLQPFAKQRNIATVGIDDLVDDTDECGFSRAVGTEQTEDRLPGDNKAYVIKREVIRVALRHVAGNQCFQGLSFEKLVSKDKEELPALKKVISLRRAGVIVVTP